MKLEIQAGVTWGLERTLMTWMSFLLLQKSWIFSASDGCHRVWFCFRLLLKHHLSQGSTRGKFFSHRRRPENDSSWWTPLFHILGPLSGTPIHKPPHWGCRCHKAKWALMLTELKPSPQVGSWFQAAKTLAGQCSGTQLDWEGSIVLSLQLTIKANSSQGRFYVLHSQLVYPSNTHHISNLGE